MEQGNLTLSRGVGSCNAEAEDLKELPPGFRFHPTDEELITHYLSEKVIDAGFDSRAVGEVDLNKCEPWDLPRRAKLGEKEWYFFCVRDRKYPTGLRTNRATEAGYWKATGKDKEIYRGKLLVGMKKTLVFYRGRAPRGEKCDWIMHEYRLEGKNSIYSLPRAAKNEWVICRVFKKTSVGSGKKAFGMAKGSSSYEEERAIGPPPPTLPPLMDIPAHVTCFSNAMECFTSPIQTALASNPSADMSSSFFTKFMPTSTASLYGTGYVNLLEAGEYFTAKQGSKTEREMLSISQETGLTTDMNPESSSDNEIGRNSFEQCLWNC